MVDRKKNTQSHSGIIVKSRHSWHPSRTTLTRLLRLLHTTTTLFFVFKVPKHRLMHTRAFMGWLAGDRNMKQELRGRPLIAQNTYTTVTLPTSHLSHTKGGRRWTAGCTTRPSRPWQAIGGLDSAIVMERHQVNYYILQSSFPVHARYRRLAAVPDDGSEARRHLASL